jgi:hypothetical protein
MKRLLNNLLGSLSSGSRKRSGSRKNSFRPQLDALEERQVPATFNVWNNADSGVGTLRQAILDSNASPSQVGVNEIQFDFAPGTINFIELKSSLPVITAAVNINGYSQAGSHENTLLNGDNAVISVGLYGEGAWTGLYIDAANVTVQGLGISHFKGDGIVLFAGADHAVIQGNYVGANGGNGIQVYSSDNVIGGELDLGHRNVITGNKGWGIEIDSIFGAVPHDNIIQDNWIGLSFNGLADGNAMGGIKLDGAFDTQIGGSTNAWKGNVIAYNNGSGILMTGAKTSLTFVNGNDIHDNFGDGVDIFYGANNNFVGAHLTSGNKIHNNTFDGVLLREGTQNWVTDNSIFANGSGIWNMQGANQGIQAPWLTSAVGGPSNVTITGSFHGKANTTYELDFYDNPNLVYYRDEGMTYLGAIAVTTDAQGNATFVANLPKSVQAGHTITAQLEGTEGSSQFSNYVTFVKNKPHGPPPHAKGSVGAPVGVGLTDAVFQASQVHRDGVSAPASHLMQFTPGQVETNQDATHRDIWSGGNLAAVLDAVWADFAAPVHGPKVELLW